MSSRALRNHRGFLNGRKVLLNKVSRTLPAVEGLILILMQDLAQSLRISSLPLDLNLIKLL